MKRFFVLLAVLAAWCSGAVAAEPPQTVLIYEVDSTEVKPGHPFNMEQLIAAIDRRINPGSFRLFRKARVRRVGYRKIEVVVSGDRPELVKRIERLLALSGTLEFRIVANRHDHEALIDRAKKEKSDRIFDADGKLLAWWVSVESGREEAFKNYDEIASRRIKRDGRETLELLLVKDAFDVTGNYLDSARPSVEPGTGKPCVTFLFNKNGARRFARLTGSNLPLGDFTRKLAIVLNGNVYSAPSIQSTISDEGIISGSFTKQEVLDIVNSLNIGTLPVRIKKVETATPPKQ